VNFSIYLILPAAQWLGKACIAGKADNLETSISQLSRQREDSQHLTHL
jgi:hypothetical protein